MLFVSLESKVSFNKSRTPKSREMLDVDSVSLVDIPIIYEMHLVFLQLAICSLNITSQVWQSVSVDEINAYKSAICSIYR